MILPFVLVLLWTQYFEIECESNRFSIIGNIEISEDTLNIDVIIINKLESDILVPMDFVQIIQNNNDIYIRYVDVIRGEIPPRDIFLNYMHIPSNGSYRLTKSIKMKEKFVLEILEIGLDFHRYEEFIFNKGKKFHKKKRLDKGNISFLVTKRLINYFYSKIGILESFSTNFYFKGNKVENCILD
jgi:hypothetical protein